MKARAVSRLQSRAGEARAAAAISGTGIEPGRAAVGALPQATSLAAARTGENKASSRSERIIVHQRVAGGARSLAPG